MAKQNPGERPSKKIMAAATGEGPKRRQVARTAPASPAMPGERFGTTGPKWPPKHSSERESSEVDDDTTEET